MAARRRLVVLAAIGLLPWSILFARGQVSTIHSFGLVTLSPWHFVSITDYLFEHTAGLPRRLELWPIGVLLYGGVLASAVSGLFDREDPRLTGGLLVVAGLAHVQVAVGVWQTGGTPVVPAGPLCMWAAAWWWYWPLVRDRGLVPAPR